MAAAGIGASGGAAVGAKLAGNGIFGIKAGADSFGNFAASSSASLIANVATRSAIEGSNFGDNVLAALPDTIAAMLQRAIGKAAANVDKPQDQINERPTDQSNLVPSLYLGAHPFMMQGGSFSLADIDLPSRKELWDTVINGIEQITGVDINGDGTAPESVIVVTGKRLVSSAETFFRNHGDDLVSLSIQISKNIPIVRQAFALNAAATKIAPVSNTLSRSVASGTEGYAVFSEGLQARAPFLAPFLKQPDILAGGVSTIVQGGLAIPQLVADPLGAGQGLVAAGARTINVVNTHSAGELASMATNKLSSMSSTRLNMAVGEALTYVVPATAGLKASGLTTKLGRFGRAGQSEVTRTNFNAYEVLSEQSISGTSRSAHRTSANRGLFAELNSDKRFSTMFNEELGSNVIAHMASGKKLLNPPGTIWHHPSNNPAVVQLLRSTEHTNPSLQSILHPEGVGGFGRNYGN